MDGTRLLKPGLDGIYATILDFEWMDASQEAPNVNARFVRVEDWPADEVLVAKVEEAYEALAPLRNTELAPVPYRFRPLSSSSARGRVCTMGRLICTMLCNAINTDKNLGTHVDGAILMGGNIRGGKEYSPDSFFSLEALEAEIKHDEVVGIVSMPGWLLSEGVRATHRGPPIPGWFQYSDGIEEDEALDAVTMVAGKPIDLRADYRIVTKISDLTKCV